MGIDPDDARLRGTDADQAFLDLSPTAHGAVRWRVDLARRDVTWAEGMDVVLGADGADDDRVRASLTELIAPLVVSAQHAPEADRTFDLEQTVSGLDGGRRFLCLHARRYGDARDGELLGLIHDVTALEHDQHALADLAGRYRLLVDLSPDAICVHQDEIVRYANPAMVEMLGAKSGVELVGHALAEFVDAAWLPKMRARLHRLHQEGDTTPRGQAELLRLDGTPVPVELVSVLTTWEGAPAHQVIGRDITAQQEAQAALSSQAALVRHVSNAIIATDENGVVTSWNPAAETIYGWTADEATGQQATDLVGTPVQPDRMVAQGGEVEALHRHRDGTALIVRISIAETDTGYVLVCADETARRRAEQDFATVVDTLDEGVLVIERDGAVASANPAAERILGQVDDDIIGNRSSVDMFDEHGRLLQPAQRPTEIARRTGKPQGPVIVRLDRGDQHVWLSMSARSLGAHDHPPHKVVTSFTDITQSRAARERLEYEATHDPLTGLANRTLVLRELGGAGRADEPVALLFLDLDEFKFINDSLGHSVGDDVLRVIGNRLVRVAGAEDVVGRLGGDEFVLVRHKQPGSESLSETARRLLDVIAEPVHVWGRDLHITGTIGIAMSRPHDARTAQDVLRDADVAMYRAKVRGGSRYEHFDVGLRERLQRRMTLEQDLRTALERDQLWVAYQPVVDLASGHTSAVEALLRWEHPVYGAVSPGEFIPIAEDTGIIDRIGAHVLRAAAHQVAQERASRDPDLWVNVNLSPRQLDNPELRSMVQQVLVESGLPGRALCLEITEEAFMQDPDAAIDTLDDLRELGVDVAIDDFGTGYSSLAQLLHLPVDQLKIDKTFVRDIGALQPVRTVVSSIVSMAHAIGLDVVAEGIETRQQLDIIRETGCDHAQGFYLGKPRAVRDSIVVPGT